MRRLALILLCLVATPLQATTYRWVDDQGKVHYGDVLPTQEATKGSSELDKQGRVKKENRSQESLNAEQRNRAQQQDLKRQEELLRRRDRALLMTYVSEAEIDLARDRALEQEEANLRGLNLRLKATQDKQAFAEGQARHYTQTGAKVPATFVQMLDEARSEKARLENQIEQRRQTMEDLKTRFEADKLRFRELVAGSKR